MESKKIYRVIRVLEYVGEKEWLENTLSRSSVPMNGNSKTFSGTKNYINSKVLSDFPEYVGDIVEEAEKVQEGFDEYYKNREDVLGYES